MVQGTAVVTLNDNKIELTHHQYIDIARSERHRIENIGTTDLIFIEVQTGDYFGEDDIIRYEDDFGRSWPHPTSPDFDARKGEGGWIFIKLL